MSGPTEAYADQLNIDTPEQVELRFPIAGLGSRFLAIFWDTLLLFLFYVIVFLVIGVAAAVSTGPAKPLNHASSVLEKWLIAGFILLNFLIVWGYFALFEAFNSGRTPGKRWVRIRVVKDSGRAITLFEALSRNLLRVVDYLPGFYLVGVISMAVTRENKRLGDLVAGTIVVHERADEQPLLAHHSRTLTATLYPKPTAMAPPPPAADQMPADAIARLGTADLHMIETFFSRALDLTVERREQLAGRVAATVCGKMGVAMPEGLPPERLLEQVAYRMRARG